MYKIYNSSKNILFVIARNPACRRGDAAIFSFICLEDCFAPPPARRAMTIGANVVMKYFITTEANDGWMYVLSENYIDTKTFMNAGRNGEVFNQLQCTFCAKIFPIFQDK